MEWIDHGVGGLRADALDVAGALGDDLAELYRALSQAGELLGFAATECFYEIGTPDSLAETELFLSRSAS